MRVSLVISDVAKLTEAKANESAPCVAWMKSAYWISTTLCPAVSVPAGFTPEGLPVGIQIVGRQGDDAGVLQIAYALEQATGFSRTKPL